MQRVSSTKKTLTCFRKKCVTQAQHAQRRLRALTLLRGYCARVVAESTVGAFDVVAATAGRVRDTIRLMGSLAEQGQEPQRTWVAEGALEGEEREAAWIEEHRHLIE